jgi:hypothetical protein
MGRSPSIAGLAGSLSMLLAAALVLLGPGAGAGATSKAVGGSRPHFVNIYATYYGWYTNTPPGCQTAYSGCAGGTGTYEDPITFATDMKEFPVGTILWYPTVEKYFVMGDECTECTADWKQDHFHHVDLWIGGKGGTEFAEINCEDALTQGTATGTPLQTAFVVDPPTNLPVSRQPLFDVRTNRCFGGATASSTYGEYKNAQSGQCLADPTGRATPGTPAVLSTCAKPTAMDVQFDGAFFVDHGLCLEIDSVTPTRPAKTVSALQWAACSGNTREQWETSGASGPIEWIQYVRCVNQVKRSIELSGCDTKSPKDVWTFVTEGGGGS